MARDDKDALGIIYERYWEPLYTSAYRIFKEKEACEDIVQDIFLKLWINRRKLIITTSLQAYLFTAVRYKVFQRIERTRTHLQLFENIEQRLQNASDTEVQLYQKELQAKVLRIVDYLPEKCQQIYRLSREEQLSHKEIAERLSITTKTVENQLTIALRRIRAGLPELLGLLAILSKRF